MIYIRKFIAFVVELFIQAANKGSSGDYLKDLAVSMQPTLKIAGLLSPFVYLFDLLVRKFSNWAFDSQDYIIVVMVAIFFDWVFGSWKHIRKGNFKFKYNAIGLVTKLSLTVGGGFLFEGFNYLTSGAPFVSSVLEVITRLVVFLYPAISAMENIYVVSNKQFPPEKLIVWFKNLYENPKIDVNSKSNNVNQEFYD